MSSVTLRCAAAKCEKEKERKNERKKVRKKERKEGRKKVSE